MARFRTPPRWAVAVFAALLFLTGLLVWLLAARGSDRELSEFQARGTAYAETFAESAAAWIERGDLDMLRTAARFLLLGSALFVRVSWDGELLVDERVGELEPTPPEGETGLASLPNGFHYLHLRIPIPPQEEPRGWVELGLDATWLAAAARARLLLAIGAGLGANLLLFGLALVLMRLRSPLESEAQPTLKVGALEIFEEQKHVRLFGEPVRLSPKQFTLLRLLASAPGRVFSDREILREVWPDSQYANSKDVKQYVYLVRQRLGKVRPGAEGMIVTVPGFGYKLVPPEQAGLTES
ncbi:TPA: winged helix family transcriptional regulator [Candidatus Bipolaricaulota bacterium]|nr:winged helix family transcriptional regulator [Candidatus Bipolaricaulota bacterium]